MQRLMRRLNKFMFWLNGYLFYTDDIIRGTYKPKKKQYTPVNKWADALNKPHIPDEPEEYIIYPVFIVFAFSYLIFKLIIDLS